MQESYQIPQEVIDKAEQEAIQAQVNPSQLENKIENKIENIDQELKASESLDDEIDELPLIVKKMGRPTKYLPEYCNVAEVICRRFGANRKQIAETLGIQQDMITKWIKTHPEFLQSIKRGREAYDIRVIEKSLRMKATGFEYEEVTIKQVTIKRGRGNDMITLPATEKTIFRKKAVPDVAACIFWLVNRQPDKWKHVARTIIQGDIKNPVVHAHGDVTDLGIALSDPQRVIEVKRVLQEAGAFEALKQDVDIPIVSSALH